MGKVKELNYGDPGTRRRWHLDEDGASQYEVPDRIMLNDTKEYLLKTVRWLEGKGPQPNPHVLHAMSRWYRRYKGYAT